MHLQKILVANRGEIALRIIRAIREMGLTAVAVYSDADREALHVRNADEALYLGAAASSESYLNQEKIIQGAKDLQVDAIHPGYGFLSENAGFADKVRQHNLIFIGPDPESIRVMGDKLSAKEAVKKFNIPLVPGTDEAITDIGKARKIAAETGYPVLIKASAGGGGKGMRIVNTAEELEEQMQRAISEAETAFGNGAVFIEKYITSPRHIEVQVIGDHHGNIVHLFERDCSVQRRHQKVIEEAPAPGLPDDIRNQLGNAAVEVARACNYYNAGTVEFIMDETGNYYFLEMNTRLQVEHPVTEQITGIDLVKEQIHIAMGNALSFRQEEIAINGHALELRVYAEDPQNNFLPDIGTLIHYRLPGGPGVRTDNAYEKGMQIPIHYDPLIAKLIVSDKNRKDAIMKMIRAIDDYTVSGIQTTLAFGRFVFSHPAFVNGTFDTKFVDNHLTAFLNETKEQLSDHEYEIAALVSGKFAHEARQKLKIQSKEHHRSDWKQNRISNA